MLKGKCRASFPSGSVVKKLPATQEAQAMRFSPRVGRIPWRRAWQPTPGFSPGESHGQRSLEGCSPWGGKESDTTEATQHGRVHVPFRVPSMLLGGKQTPRLDGTKLSRGLQGGTEKPPPCLSCVKCNPGTSVSETLTAGRHSPVSVLDRQVLLHSFHQVPEALGKDLLLGERLAVYQTCPQFPEILLGDRTSVRGWAPNGLKKAVGAGPDQL